MSDSTRPSDSGSPSEPNGQAGKFWPGRNATARDPMARPRYAPGDERTEGPANNGEERKHDVFYDDELTGKPMDVRLLKRLLRYLAPHKKLLVVVAILTLFLAVIEVYWPMLLGQFIDGPFAQFLQAATTGEQIDANLLWTAVLLPFVGLFVGYLVLQFFTQWLYTYATGALGQRTIAGLREELFEHLQKLPLSYFDRNPVGRLVTRVTSDIEALAELFTSGIVQLAADLLRIFVIFVVMFLIDVTLGLMVLAITPFLVVASWYFGMRMRRGFRETRKRLASVNAYLQESISGMPMVQTFRQEEKAYDALRERNMAHYHATLTTIFNFALFAPIVGFFAHLALAGLLFIGGMKLLEGAPVQGDGEMLAGVFTLGAFTTFYFWTRRLFEPLRELSEKYNILQAAMASSERIFRIIDTDPQIVDPPAERAVKLSGPIRGAIDFEHVWFAYRDEEWILKDVSFKVEPGQRIALVGATGSGKTTITNLIPRFYDIQHGHIRVDGHDVRDYRLADLRRHIAIVLQDVFLFTGTIERNIRLGSEQIDRKRVEQVVDELGAREFIERLPEKFEQDVMERGLSLSTGQRQLIAFARALAFDPRILILDEATANIDTESEALVQSALETLLRGRTSIIVAHRLSTIKSADQILVIHKGEIRERGTHDELLARNDIYAKLYALQYQAERGSS